MKIGSTDIVNCKIGSTQVKEVRIGSTLVWQFLSVDPDAQAFITAAGITNPTQQTAINTLVLSLKANSIWAKMKAIYPFVGGTASSHKFNLKNPLDTNAAFRLSFVGGWTHSATGALPNGTNGYANTFFKPLTNGLTYNNNHISFYSRTSSSLVGGGFYEMGCGNNVVSDGLTLWSRRSANTAGYDSGNYVTNRLTFLNTDGKGFYCGTSPNTTSKFFKNGVSQGSKLLIFGLLNDANVFIGGFNEYDTSTIYYSFREQAFASIGNGLNDTEAANFYTAVQAYQTTLGRQV